MQPTIELENIGKSFPGVVALREVSLVLRGGRVHALVGENGAGKSTLINVLSGGLAPDHGTIRLDGAAVRFPDAHAARRLGVVTVHQEGDLFPDLSVAENIALEQGLPASAGGWIDPREQRRRAAHALDLLHAGLGPDTPAAALTPAQRQLVTLSAALAQPSRALILDEPTSSLSAAETARLFELLRHFRARGTAILYVSHRFEEIFALADEVTVLRDGRRVWTGALAATTPAALIHLMVGRETAADVPRRTSAPGPVSFRCEDLRDAGGAVNGVTLEARAGEILGLYGLVGAGRSEWAQTVLGLRPLDSGSVWLNGAAVRPHGPGPMARAGLAYVPEDRLRQGLCRGLSLRANVVLATLRRLAVGPFVSRAAETRRTRAICDRLQVRCRSLEQPAGTLSGGNQQKLVLGRWLEREPTVLLLDEPTRGIDVGAKSEVHALIRRLADEGRAVVLISSDLPEVLAQSDRVGVFRDGRLVAEFNPHASTPAEVAAAALPDAPTASEGSPAPARPEPPPSRLWLRCARWLPLRELALLVLLLLLAGFLQLRTGQFLQPSNLQNLATDTALLSFCALGATLVILAGGIDVSLGSLMAFSAAVAGGLWQRDHSLAVVIPVAMLVGGAGGLGNAALTLLGRVHPIVVTLGTLSLYRGLTLWWLGSDVQIDGAARAPLLASLLSLPLLAWLGLALALALAVGLRRTAFGRQLYAVGSNPAAARRVGVSVARVWLAAFTLQGMLAGLAGLLYLARSGNLQPVSYEGSTLEAIGAAVVGGVAITGGRGSVLGVLLGCLFLVTLPTACLFLHIPTTWQRTLVGGITVFAVALDSLWRRRSP
jgi:ABC-type sugar transport system ATPase subunit/ribose/xylose/arabinose/galactoside ABC-type transport system permease subunit